MNFIKGLYNKFQKETNQPLFDFSILGSIYRYQNNTYVLLSSNTEVVFDQLNNDQFDHIMIIRYQRVSRSYCNVPLKREGDFYFNVSFITTLTESEFDINTTEFRFKLIDSKKLEWDIKLQFPKYGYQNIVKLEEFRTWIMKLRWVFHNKKAVNQIKSEEQYIQYIKRIEIQQEQQEQKLLAKSVVKQKPAAVNKNILSELTIRTPEEKDIIGDGLNYYLTGFPHITQLFVGKLYSLQGQELKLVNPIIILAVNQITKLECNLEVYDLSKRLLLSQPILGFIQFNVDSNDNYISWLYCGGDECQMVLFIKFDQIDGALTSSMFIQRQKLKLSKIQSVGQIDNKWTEQIIRNKAAEPIKQQEKILYDDKTTLLYDHKTRVIRLISVSNKIILITQQSVVIFDGDNYKQQVVNIQITQKYDKCSISNNLEQAIFYKQFQQQYVCMTLVNNTYETVNTHHNIVDMCHTMNSGQFMIISPKLIMNKLNQRYSLPDNITDNLSVICCTKQNQLIVGTQQGSVLLFDDVESMQLINVFPPTGDPVKQIVMSNDYALINYGIYMHLQPTSTILDDGFKQPFTIKPVPTRIQLQPDDLMVLGLFDDTQFQNVCLNDNCVCASISNIQLIWNMNSLINHNVDSYQVQLLEDTVNDQILHNNNIIVATENQMMSRSLQIHN